VYSQQYEKELEISRNCRSCGMCRIDYLGTGQCAAAEEHVYAAHHPHGRLKIFNEMVSGELPFTSELSKVVDSCTLCGKCNIQCYFQVEMTPGDVFSAKRKVFSDMLQTKEIVTIEADDVLNELHKIVGDKWASNDPVILTSYATFGSLSSDEKVPAYVVLPENGEETAAIVRLANKHKIPYLPISSGTNSSNLIKDKIILIDMNRMKSLVIDTENCNAEVGAGVIAFDLQQQAMKNGLRMSIGEAAAGVCANQVSTGIHSFFAYKNGMMSDHYIEAELVNHQGELIRLLSEDAPQITSSPKDHYQPVLPYICTKLKIKLYPVENDETVIFIPFNNLEEALDVTKKLAENSIGTGMGLLGVEVLSSFISITEEDAENFLDIANEYLKIKYSILMLLNSRDHKALTEMFPDLTIVEQDSMQRIIQGVPAITGPESMVLIEDVMDEEKPYDHLFGDMLEYFLKQIKISPQEVTELFAHIDDKNLRKTLDRRYFEPEFSDPKYWFNYRMFSPRFVRTHWFFSVMHFTDTNDFQLIDDICKRYKKFGELHDIENSFCYIMPIDGGKRFFFEYEFFCDQRDEEMLQRLKKVFFLLAYDSKQMVNKDKGVYPVLNTLFNGMNNRECYLYNNFDENK
jgi:FAD binding domain-containing protein